MRYLFWTILTAVVAVRYVVTTPHYEDGQKLRITTRVSSEPVKYDDAQYFKVAGLKVYLPLYPEVGYGDKIIVEGEVKEGKLVKPVLNKVTESDKVIDQFLNHESMDLQWWQTAINFYAETQRADRLESILLRLTQRDPKNSLAWYNLAALQAATQKGEQAIVSLKKAFKLDANLIRNIQNDARFANIRGIEKFQKLIQ